MSEERNKLFDVRLDDHNFVARNPEVEHERRIAIYDLLEDNRFEIVGSDLGPYALCLKHQETRLIFKNYLQRRHPCRRHPVVAIGISQRSSGLLHRMREL